MDTQRLLASGLRGTHLLFDRGTISEAFAQSADDLREVVDLEIDTIQGAVEQLIALPDAEAGRSYIEALPRCVQYVMVLLYFELLDGTARRGDLILH